ncbi:Cytochrome c-type biogenesis protein CycH [Oleispira antarctica RB-8]|uniref:Cytochrome c-type biogenesis protein CycH n=1 Tax=Oleispira antarctica RB-8 TaxID=698738 RepID=R4YNA3_OLEAN|nr:Cytochrome c-type biogenesis protein CycH [Oleispira antarctica RB-8]
MIILGLLLVTLGFMVWPAFSNRNHIASREAENLRLYEQRKQEINEADYADEEREQMMLELDHELVASDADIANGSDATPKQKILTSFVLFILMVSGVLFIYQDMGAQDELVATQLLNKMSSAKLSDEEQKTLKESLRKASISKPENGEWLYLYARMLFADGQYMEGVATFEKILATLPEDAKADRAATLVQIAQGKFYIADQKASESIYSYVQEALVLEPKNSQALGLAGILAFELGHLEEALVHWKALWFNMSSSPEAGALEQGIQRIAESLEALGQTVDLSWMKRAEVRILVSISEELKSQLKDDDAVFVMAKAVTGPVMPLAALRVMAKDLPMEVVLNDSQGMVPGLALSKFEEVQVIARVAKGGQPMANSGDFQGIVKPVMVKSDDTVELVIDQIVP